LLITWSLANKGKRHNNEGEFMNISALSLYLPIVVSAISTTVIRLQKQIPPSARDTLRVLRGYLINFVCSQIWLNYFLDDHHYGYITKSLKETLTMEYHGEIFYKKPWGNFYAK